MEIPGMKKIALILFSVSLFFSGICAADTVFLKSQDRINGQIENGVIFLQTDYGMLRFQREFIKSMSRQDGSGKFTLRSINNDFFSGRFSGDGIEITTHDTQRLRLEQDRISGIHFGSNETAVEIETVLFVMENGDKFTGRLLDEEIEIQNEYGEVAVATKDLSRVDFFGKNKVAVAMNNGNLINGQLTIERLRVAPNAAEAISVCTGRIATILYHVQKLAAKTFENRSGSPYDNDGDGVPDRLDACPDSTCMDRVDETGCPPVMDEDGDGVTDDRDQCPATPRGVKANEQGCWVIGLPLFDTNSSRIKIKHYPLLDEVVSDLEKNPALRIEVQGHSDNVGTDAVNLRLTRDRARAVLEYLTGQNIARDRLEAKGYGSARPVADNDTDAGRAKNRRVELRPIP
jgi:outer membrane protein OmpA-like peptidoglycan-associated protein